MYVGRINIRQITVSSANKWLQGMSHNSDKMHHSNTKNDFLKLTNNSKQPKNGELFWRLHAEMWKLTIQHQINR